MQAASNIKVGHVLACCVAPAICGVSIFISFVAISGIEYGSVWTLLAATIVTTLFETMKTFMILLLAVCFGTLFFACAMQFNLKPNQTTSASSADVQLNTMQTISSELENFVMPVLNTPFISNQMPTMRSHFSSLREAIAGCFWNQRLRASIESFLQRNALVVTILLCAMLATAMAAASIISTAYILLLWTSRIVNGFSIASFASAIKAAVVIFVLNILILVWSIVARMYLIRRRNGYVQLDKAHLVLVHDDEDDDGEQNAGSVTMIEEVNDEEHHERTAAAETKVDELKSVQIKAD